MAKQLSILFVTSEMYPYVKASGLGDVAYSFPLAMRDLGEDIRVMLPKYGIVSERKNKIHEINRLKDFSIKIGDNVELATVKSSSVNNPRTKVQAYITTNFNLFDAKKGVYADAKTGEIFPDNDERYIFFARTVVETCVILGWMPDIIHCNDWYTAMVPAFAKLLYPAKFKKTKFIYTIHNFEKQGVFPPTTFRKTGLPKELMPNFLHKDRFNFLKVALTYADHFTTVSETYKKEILVDNKHGDGLNKMLVELGDKFDGILNAIDKYAWDPKTDIHLKAKFEDDFEEYKSINKKDLLNTMGLKPIENAPLIGIVSRLDHQKGINLFIEAADKIFKENVQVVMLGQGEKEMKDKVQAIQEKYPEKFACKFEFDDILAHQVEAGTDIFLMPSLFEPCGLNAMYSQIYGSVPLVRSTGGLKEIVKNYNEKTKEGNGLTFNDFNEDSLIKAINNAIALYAKPEQWSQLVSNAMSMQWRWNESIKKYHEIYKSITKD
jgi:starch synthase